MRWAEHAFGGWIKRLKGGLLAAEGGKLAVDEAKAENKAFVKELQSPAYLQHQATVGEKAKARALLAEGRLAAAAHDFERAIAVLEAGVVSAEALGAEALGAEASEHNALMLNLQETLESTQAAVATRDQAARAWRQGRSHFQQRAPSNKAATAAPGVVSEDRAVDLQAIGVMMRGAGLDPSVVVSESAALL